MLWSEQPLEYPVWDFLGQLRGHQSRIKGGLRNPQRFFVGNFESITFVISYSVIRSANAD